MNWYKFAQNVTDMTEDEFIDHHRTGDISSDAYEDYADREGLSWMQIEGYPVLHSQKVFGDMPIEFRQNGEKNKYVRTDDNDEIVRDEKGLALYLTDEEIRLQGKDLYNNTIVAFEQGEAVGLVSDEWGVPGVWVVDEMQSMGIGTYLLSEWMKNRKPDQILGQMTPAGESLARSYYRQLVEEANQPGDEEAEVAEPEAIDLPPAIDPNLADDDARVEWVEQAVAAVTDTARSHGWSVYTEPSSRSFSQYVTLDRGDEVIEVRISDHESGIHGSGVDHALIGTHEQAWIDLAWRDLSADLMEADKMNWHKESQSNLWDMSEKDYAGPWDERYGDDEDAYKEWWNKRREWKGQMQRAIGRGEINPQTARDRGLLLNVGNIETVKPLPQRLYHVTTARDEVINSGLKTREELSQGLGLGLGGGASDTISFTTDIDVARAIKSSLLDGVKVAKNKISIEQMLDMAAKGEDADRPWLKNIYYYHSRKDTDEMPIDIKATLEGYEYTDAFIFPKTVEEQNEKDEWEWEPVGEAWPHGTGVETKYTRFRRRLTSDELIDKRFDLYKEWITFREEAGGPLNPLFFLSDAVGLSKVDPEQVSIMEFVPKPNAMGYQVSSLGEWRTWDGTVLEPIGVVE